MPLHVAPWILPDGTRRWAFSVPYSGSFVYRLKETIPATERAWFPQLKLWVVDLKHGDTVRQLVGDFFEPKYCLKCWPRETGRACSVWATFDRRAAKLGLGSLAVKERPKAAPPPPPPRPKRPSRPADPFAAARQLLGVAILASEAEIKSAARRASFDAHPDRPGGSHERQVEVIAARDLLLGRGGRTATV